jgi:hypothetical protein
VSAVWLAFFGRAEPVSKARVPWRGPEEPRFAMIASAIGMRKRRIGRRRFYKVEYQIGDDHEAFLI